MQKTYRLSALLIVLVAALLASRSRPLQAQSGLATSAPTEDRTKCVENDQASEIFTVAFSPDGRYLVANSISGGFRMWDVATGEVIRDFPIYPYAPTGSVTFSPDGKYVLTSLQVAYAILWDAMTGQQVHKFEGDDDKWGLLGSAAFSVDGKYILIGFALGARLWDTQTGALVHDFRNPYKVPTNHGKAEISPDGKRVLVSSGYVALYDVETGAKLFDNDDNQASFSPDGKYFVTYEGGGDGNGGTGVVQLWDAKEYTPVHIFDSAAEYLGFSSDGKYLWTEHYPANQEPTLALWEVATGKKIQSFRGVQASFFHNKDHLLTEDILVSDVKMRFRVWDSIAESELWNFVADEGMTYERLFISPDDNYVAIANNTKVASVHLLDIRTGQLIRRFC